MAKNINFYHLLFLYGIMCQGIVGTLSAEDIKKSSEFLVREKRVINLGPGGSLGMRIEHVPYIVNIQENGRNRCAGSILSHYNVITAERCILFNVSLYRIQAGSAYTQNSVVHNITSKETYFGNAPHGIYDGISLLVVDPPFEFNHRIGFIHLYVGPLHDGAYCTIVGWGCKSPLLPAVNLDRKLRSISLTLINHQTCVNSYPQRLGISHKHLCTHSEQKMCARNDAGAPLVVHGLLTGIHVYKGETQGQTNPDVYINFQSDNYIQWITEHSLLM